MEHLHKHAGFLLCINAQQATLQVKAAKRRDIRRVGGEEPHIFFLSKARIKRVSSRPACRQLQSGVRALCGIPRSAVSGGEGGKGGAVAAAAASEVRRVARRTSVDDASGRSPVARRLAGGVARGCSLGASWGRSLGNGVAWGCSPGH